MDLLNDVRERTNVLEERYHGMSPDVQIHSYNKNKYKNFFLKNHNFSIP